MRKAHTLLTTLLGLLIFVINAVAVHADAPPVTATEDATRVVMDNGIVTLEVAKAKSQIVSIKYRHDGKTTEMSKTMYYSSAAGPNDPNAPRPPSGSIQIRQNRPTHLVQSGPEMAEVVMENGPTPSYPFHTETHYLLPRGESGYYAYQIYSHPADQPGGHVGEARFVLKGPPGPELFDTHVVDEKRMAPYDTSPSVQTVSDATFLLQDGTIYTKYDNTAFLGEHFVHGMTGHGVGIWMVNASNEFVNGGPLKQELTVHADNTLLNMLQGGHFGSGGLDFKTGEAWTKFYGPILVYMNSGNSTAAMYKDALHRVRIEQTKWPYQWVKSADYPTLRGTVSGKISFANTEDNHFLPGSWAILAAPGMDWAMQASGYEFWTRVGADGTFTIPKVRPGSYTLSICGGNQFEQYIQNDIKVEAGKTTDLGKLTWKPITHGKTLWQIGVADRGTTEFHDGDNVRHFANFLRYGKDFPDDVTFTLGKSHEKTDWNFAQWTWYSKKPYWAIDFDLRESQVRTTGKATLTLGIAASVPVRGNRSNLQIKVNGQEVSILHLEKSGAAGYRSGGQDSLYRVVYVTFDAALLKSGTNEITLGHTDAQPLPTPEEQKHGRVGCVMYDAIRLEVVLAQEVKPTPKVVDSAPKSDPHLPTLFIIGDSTVKNHTKGLEGWGDPIAKRFDRTKINVQNRALGGRSSRTFLTEGLWEKTLADVKAGDFVLMQFGHNDGGSLKQSYRASLKGNGEETEEVNKEINKETNKEINKEVADEKTGKTEVVHTFGWYLRKYITDTKAKGATPIVLSPVPRNIWTTDKTVARASNDYGKWAAEAAKAEGMAFIDLNGIIAHHYEEIGKGKVTADFFPGDHTHTSPAGAELNAASVVEGLRALKSCPLVAYLADSTVKSVTK